MYRGRHEMGGGLNSENFNMRSRQRGQMVNSIYGGSQGKRVADREQGGKRLATSEDSGNKNGNREKSDASLKKTLTKALSLVAAGVVLIGGVTYDLGLWGNHDEPTNRPPIQTKAAVTTPSKAAVTTPSGDAETSANYTKYSGELSNGVHYDYTIYASGNKPSPLSFGEDATSSYTSREAAIAKINQDAYNNPTILADYATIFFDESEKQDLGISGMTSNQINAYMADESNFDGGHLQDSLLAALDSALADENATITFGQRNDWRYTDNIKWTDENGDGKMTPDEMVIGHNYSKRENASYIGITRPNGIYVELNGGCDNQPQSEIPSPGTEDYTEEDQPGGGTQETGGDTSETGGGTPKTGGDDTSETGGGTPETGGSGHSGGGTPTSTPNWGKYGDPHGGPDVTTSAPVNPASKVSKEENDNTNKGNQGYVDDQKATPGSFSENNDVVSAPEEAKATGIGEGFAASGIKADGSDNSGIGEFGVRIHGGETQVKNESGTAEMAGENAYQTREETTRGRAVDKTGNDAQSNAYETLNRARAEREAAERSSSSDSSASSSNSRSSASVSTSSGTSVGSNDVSGTSERTESSGAIASTETSSSPSESSASSSSTESSSPAGQDNYSDAQEEAAVAGGNF